MRYFKTVNPLNLKVYRADLDSPDIEYFVTDRWEGDHWAHCPGLDYYVRDHNGEASLVIVEISKGEAERLIGQKIEEGSAASGNYGHAGRPGEVGGSGPGGGGPLSDEEKAAALDALSRLPLVMHPWGGTKADSIELSAMFSHPYVSAAAGNPSERIRGVLEPIDITKLEPTQPVVSAEGTKRYIADLPAKVSMVAELNGRFFLMSGHTRVAAQILAGRKTVMIQRYMVDPETHRYVSIKGGVRATGPKESLDEGGPGSGRYPKGSGGQNYLHGTNTDALKGILKDGITPASLHNWAKELYTSDREGSVFVTTSRDMASQWAWKSCVGKHADATPIILTILVPRRFGFKADLKATKADFYTNKTIKAEWIRAAHLMVDNAKTGARSWRRIDLNSVLHEEMNERLFIPMLLTGHLQEGIEDGIIEGSETSGNYGHAGRPGEVGGSGPGGAGELDPNEVRDYRTLPQYTPEGTGGDRWREITGEKTAAVVNMDRDLDMTELGSVMDYTGNGNGSINRWLKGYDVSAWREPADVEKLVGHIDSTMKVSQTNDNITLFRGVSFEKMRKLELIAEQKGTFTDKGFVSCTTQKDITSDFGHSIKILVPKGFPAISVPRIASNKAWENEVILNRGVTFKVDIIKAVVPGRSIPEQLIILRPMNKGHHG